MSQDNNTSQNKRIAKNTLALYLRMMLQMLIGLYTSRVILQALGVDDFGIYNVVGSVTAMLSLINGAMSNATMRFITFELGRDNQQRLNDVFCVSMNIHIIIAIITFIFLDTFGLWFLYNKMIIAPDRLDAAFWVLQFSIVTCVMSILSVPYNACIIAHERMGTFALISLYQTLFTLLLALFLPHYSGDRLILYAIILMAVQLTMQLIYFMYCKKHFSETSYRLIWKKPLFAEMAKFAGWTMNGNIAWLGYTQGLNILINMFFGTAVNAARGVAFNVQSKIMGFCDNFQTAVRPQITKTYSSNDFKRMHSLIIGSSKFSYYLLLLLSLPVYIEIEEILRIWLGIVPEHTANFVRIILLCSAIDILRNPMNAAIHATGNIKKFQLWEANTLLLIIPVAYVVLKLGFPVEYAFIVQLIIFVIVQIERVFIVCPQIYMRKMDYLRFLILPIIKVTLSAIAIPILLMCIWKIERANWIQFTIYIILSLLSSSYSIYLWGLRDNEKEKVILQIKKLISKLKNK